MTTQQIAWLTRHKPTLEQRRDLCGYVIRQPAFCRYQYPPEMWQLALDITNGHPALIIVVLPSWMFNGLASLAHIRMGVPVVRPVTPEWGQWTGEWRRTMPLPDGGFEWSRWIPEGSAIADHDALREQLRAERPIVPNPRKPVRDRRDEQERGRYADW